MEAAGHRIIHDITPTHEINAQHNFARGRIGAFEDFLGLAEELEEWKQMHKKRRSE